MYPSIEDALQELKIAGELNPGPWVQHSINVGLAAKKIAHCIPEMDEDIAQVFGLLHDIGRRVGIVNIPKHVYEGYRYCMSKGWDEVARICMTHSYVRMQDEFEQEEPLSADGEGQEVSGGGFHPTLQTMEERAIRDYILTCGDADEYDKLIQLCDSLATDYGFVILEKRFVDVTRRYGIMEDYIKGWEVIFGIKEAFEAKMGCSVYDVLPDIGKTTLLSPKPWTPPKQ